MCYTLALRSTQQTHAASPFLPTPKRLSKQPSTSRVNAGRKLHTSGGRKLHTRRGTGPQCVEVSFRVFLFGLGEGSSSRSGV